MSLNMNNSHKKLVRPGMELGDGQYRLDCHAAEVLTRSMSDALSLGGTLYDEDGNRRDETLSLLCDWRAGSPFFKLLELAECMPEPNGEFDPSDLVGWTFTVEIKMNSKNGRDFPNIVDIELPDDDE